MAEGTRASWDLDNTYTHPRPSHKQPTQKPNKLTKITTHKKHIQSTNGNKTNRIRIVGATASMGCERKGNEGEEMKKEKEEQI